MKNLGIIFYCLCFIFSCGNSSSKDIVKKNKKNIVLIVVDDLGWRDLGFMGSDYYQTPRLDAFAKQGMIFTNAYAAAANCAPSRACMLSGLNTPSHGVYTVGPSDRGDERTRKLIPIHNKNHLHDSIYTLPEMLKSAGYITGNFGKWHIGDNPNTQGIDVNVGGSSRGNPGKNGYFSPYKINHIKNGPKGEYLTDRLTQESISFITKNKDTTFFAYIPFYTVHSPLQAQDSWIDKYKHIKGANGQNNPVYGAMVSAMDANVGKILETLDILNLSKNTIVIFTSDNGGIRTTSNQEPLRAGKGSYYEGGIKVPLVIRWPDRIKEGTTNTNLVSNLDFYPTLQDIAEPKTKATLLDGISLLNQFNDTIPRNRELFFHFPIYLQKYNSKFDDSRDPLFRTRPGSVIISNNWKMHHYFEDNAFELYNLDNDIGERNNIARTYPKIVNNLLLKLNTWRSKMNAPIPTIKNPKYDSTFELQQLEKAMQ